MSRVRRLLLVTGLIAALGVLPAGAQIGGGRCAERFPEATFDTAASAGPVAVHGSGVTQPLLDRYARDWGELVELIQSEMGGLDGGVAVCVFEDDLPLDTSTLDWPANQALRAAAFGEDRLVVISSWLIAFTPDAGRAGLIHVAQYQLSEGTYPEPFAGDVAGWYRNRVDRTVEVVHNAFVRQNSGLTEPWPAFAWTMGPMSDPIAWNPEVGYGGAGDFTNYVVAVGGTEVLTAPLETDLALLDEGWRQTLFDESGAIPGGSKGWILGLVMVIGVLSLGALLAWLNHRQKRKVAEQLRDLDFLDRMTRQAQAAAAVRPSVPGGTGRRHTRVRSRASRPGRDRDHRDRSPAGGGGGSRNDPVPKPTEAGDDAFRHPGFDGDDRST